MPPRFMERMQRQSAVYRSVYGEPPFDPPPYPFSRSKPNSESSRPSSQQSVESPPPSYRQGSSSGSFGSGPEPCCIPTDSLILVTGADTFQGTHIVDQLLHQGYRVRGVVASAEQAVSTAKYFMGKYGSGRYATAIIPQTTAQGSFDVAAKTCSGIIHIPQELDFSSDPNIAIPPVIAGAINALEAAAKEPGVRRFVYCSSATAAANAGNGFRTEVTSDTWNMGAFKAAWEPPPYEVDRAWAVYAASKMQAEQAVWRWHRDRRPNFVLNCVLPDMVWGAILDPQNPCLEGPVGVLKHIFDGNAEDVAWTPPQHFADVQDSALLHVAALVLPDVTDQRIFVATAPYNINSILQLLGNLYPNREFIGGVDDHGVDLTIYPEAYKAEDLLRRMGKSGWTSLEDSVRASCKNFF